MVKADAIGLTSEAYGPILDPSRLGHAGPTPARSEGTAATQQHGDSISLAAARAPSPLDASSASQLRELGGILRDLGAYADRAASAAEGGSPASHAELGAFVDSAHVSLGMLEALSASD